MLKDVDAIVLREIHEVLQEEGRAPRPGLDGDAAIAELGLESLMFARLILQLEQELGVDPFAAETTLADIRTVGDLTDAYQRALAAQPA